MPDTTAEQGSTPVSETELQVVRLFETGLNSPDIMGFHGTSIEAVLHLSKHGVLPPGFVSPNFYFAPITDAQSFEQAHQHASDYARWSGWVQFILPHLLPYLPENTDPWIIKDLGHNPKGIYDLIGGKLPAKEVDRLCDEADQRGGVVLALSKNLAKDYIIKDSPDADPVGQPELIVEEKNGLPIKHVVGIEPQGDYEWRVLEELQERSSPKMPNSS